ncbi:MAG: PEP-CTERM sorting domain-containing protein, partial [Planctomycetota bacterium]
WFRADQVAIDETTAVIGEAKSGTAGDSTGGVYFFTRSEAGEWEFETSFTTYEDRYRSAVRFDGDVTLARDFEFGGLTIYERGPSGWEETTQVTRPYIYGHHAGFAVDEDLVAYGSGEGTIEDPFRVDLYQRHAFGDWRLQTSIYDPEPELGRDFGASIAIDSGRVLIGTTATRRNPGARNSDPPAGAAYLFVPVPEPSTALLTATLAAALVTKRRRLILQPLASDP